MYPWQAAALECGRNGSNLVYCAPTSGGKSLVAEILMIRRLSITKPPGKPHGGYHVSSFPYPSAYDVHNASTIVTNVMINLSSMSLPLRLLVGFSVTAAFILAVMINKRGQQYSTSLL